MHNISTLKYTTPIRYRSSDSAIWPEKKYRPTKVIILTQKIDKEFTSVGFHETVFYKNSFIYVKFLTETIYQQKLIYRTGAQRLS